MTFRIISASTVGFGQQVYMPMAGDITYIPGGILVGAEEDVCVIGESSSQRVIVDGTVMGGGPAGIQLGNSAVFDKDISVHVGRTGIVRGTAVALAVAAYDSHVVIYGQIGGGVAGILMSAQGPGLSRIINHGEISAETGIGRTAMTDSETLHITNWGILDGRTWAYDGMLQEAIDIIVNRGLISGDVRLGGGDDRFDTRGAGEVVGQVFGGTGNDTFLLGAAEDVIDGGAGIDTIDATASGAIILALDGTVAGSGRTAGDTLTGIEAILGSRLGSDYLTGTTGAQTLTGQGGADRLEGRGGNDSLSGGDGNDRLVGQTGADVLTGGAGDDRFIFRALVEAGDTLADFGAVSGNNDAFEVTAAGFGGGLVRGTLPATAFQTRADNVAQDADDRFIYRTTDSTVWFDSNGNGSGGLTLLATLPAGTVLDYRDFILV